MREDRMEPLDDEAIEEVAVVGMAGRFPGAGDLEELWRNLRDGVESITFFSDAELLASGVDPGLLSNPAFVRASGVLEGADRFDAGFFGYGPREAAILDPQQRVFLECAWEALEQAAVASSAGRVGVYAGSIFSTYLLRNLLPQAAAGEAWPMVLANDKDTLSTRVSYELDLRGPSVTVQTACSTSLVAVHLARQSLLDYDCDLALAGGVAVRFPQVSGYLSQEGGIFSPDGRCRAFDARARGTIFTSGVGIVVLKRLSEALEDGDTIRAVLKGSAINNDGSNKVGFTAPGVEGQAEVVARCLALAGVNPETVGYVECHGTATPMGDPIEVAALTRAFRAAGAGRRGFCALGSIKSNLGHLDAAAGVAGLIKAVLAVERGEIPPTLHFETPNPEIDFAGSPFFVNDRLRAWDGGDAPRRAGVSSLGIGGTNAHVIVEQAPPLPETDPARPAQLLVLSARTPSALERAAERLAGHLESRGGQDLGDVAFTLQAGRRALPWRRAVVCRGREDAVAALRYGGRAVAGRAAESAPGVAFLLPGAGHHLTGTGSEVYREEKVFRDEIDRAAEIVRPVLDEDLRDVLFPAAGQEEAAGRRLSCLNFGLPALFAVETALARLWMSWGIRPDALLGHSRGEYVAAHLAGVMSLEDALLLVTERGRLIEQLPRGAVLAVPLAEAEVVSLLSPELSLAAVNGPLQCVVSGPEEGVSRLRAELAARGVESKVVPASRPYHSREMEPLIEPFAKAVRRVTLRPPEIPLLSGMTGRWATAEEMTDPVYWALSMRRTVRFADALEALLAEPGRVLLEVGPGRALSRLARRTCDARGDAERVIAASLDTGNGSEPEALLHALGRLWTAGVEVDWKGFHAGERRRRVPLPSYPFERERHWMEARPARAAYGVPAPAAGSDPSGWFLLPSWRRSVPPAASPVSGAGSWLVLVDGCGLGEELARRLEQEDEQVVRVAGSAEVDGALLEADLRGVLHLRAVTRAGAPAPDLAQARRLGLDSLDSLTRALAAAGREDVTVVAVSNGVQRVTGEEELCPAKATLLGWARTPPSGRIRRRSVDIVLPEPGSARRVRLVERLLAEVRSTAAEPVVAWRGEDRWVPSLEPATLPAPSRPAAWLRPGGSYLVTGEAALAAARRLTEAAPVRIAWIAPPGPALGGSLDQGHALEDTGAEVLLLEADPSSEDSLRRALARCEEVWGMLDGVIALPGRGGPAEWMRDVLALDAALGDDRPAGFFALSSWNEPPAAVRDRSELWAAGALLDAVAQARAARGAAPAVAIDWRPGTDLGSDEAFAALERILAHRPAAQVVVSLPARRPAEDLSEDAAEEADGGIPGDDPLALRIAAIWREVLGVRRVGLHDSFFDLGGDSLIALQVTSRLREAFPVELPMRALFETPTLSGLRDVVEEALTRHLEELPEEEAQRLVESLLG